jgi:hypothetical protein
MLESTKTQQPVDPDPKGVGQKTGMIDLPHRWDRFEPLAEILAILILATATLATAWSGYQSARWSGVQAADYSRAGATRVESSRASAIAGQQMQIDIGLFTNWINAYADNNQQLTDFYRARFRETTRMLQNPRLRCRNIHWQRTRKLIHLRLKPGSISMLPNPPTKSLTGMFSIR